MSTENAHDGLFEFLLRLGDDSLISGHRLSEWCGHAPILEEDIALANMALDCIGTANSILALAGEQEGKGRSADDLAYFRSVREFRNCLLVEQPNGDFAFTVLKQYLFSVYEVELYSNLSGSANDELAGIARRTAKERRYHARHCGEWVLRLGLGTDESHRRAQQALDQLWGYTSELIEIDPIVARVTRDGSIPDLQGLAESWRGTVLGHLGTAELSVQSDTYQHSGGRNGRHTEHLGRLLDEMQVLARSHPDASW